LEAALRVFRYLILVMLFHPLPLAAASPEATQYYIAGSKLYYQKQYDQALQDFAYSLRLDNTQANAYQFVGSCYYAKNQPALALRYYQYALRMNPSNTALQGVVARLSSSQQDPLAQGNQLYMAKDYHGALAAYQGVAAQQPQNAKAFQCIGNSEYALGDLAAALTAYKQSLAINPSNQPLADFVTRLDAAQTAKLNGGNLPNDWFQPLWRSAILPGWGQGYNGQDTKGWILGTSYVVLWAATITTYEIGTQAENKYLSLGANLSQSAYNSPYDTWSDMSEINHIAYIAVGVVWVYSLIDAIVNSRPAQSLADMPSPLPANMSVALMDHGAQVRWKVADF
jgi:tetratricopeptide (TPR) repeat protein